MLKKMQKIFSIFISLVLLIVGSSCNTTEPGEEGNGWFSVDGIVCTESWLKIAGSKNNERVAVYRDGSEIYNIKQSVNDTVLYDSKLEPGKTYKYQAMRLNGTTSTEKSPVITAGTLNLTSDNFSWEIKQLGDFGRVLYDVAIINDTLAYAVGEMYMKDSTGQYDTDAYNAVKWDGKSFTPFRILFEGECGAVKYPPLRAIYAFSPTDIVVATGGLIGRFNGENLVVDCSINPLLTGNINRVYGKSSNDLYVAGNKGNIIHYTNGKWQKVESGTNYDLFDISSADGKDFYVSGGNFQNYNGVLLKGNASGFKTIAEGRNVDSLHLFHPYFAGIGSTLWESNSNTIYFGGNLLYRYKSGQMDLVRTLLGNNLYVNNDAGYQGFLSKLRGNRDNDIMLVGELNTIRHFNGKSWQQLGTPYGTNSDYTWLFVDMKKELAIAAGRSGSNAIMMILKRK